MKHLLFTFFTLLTLTAFGQPTGNMEEDTARANRLYEEAMGSLPEITEHKINEIYSKLELGKSMEEIDAIKLLNEAIAILNQYPVSKQKIKFKSELAFLYGQIYDPSAIDLCFQTIQEATENNIDSLDNCLHKSYFTILLINYSNGDFRKDIPEKAYQTAVPSTHDYIYFQYIYLKNLVTKNSDEYEVKILEFEQYLKDTKNQKFQYGLSYYYCLQSTYFLEIVQNTDKSIIYGKKALEENEKYNILHIETIANIHYELGNAYEILKNYSEANKEYKRALQLTKDEDFQGIIYLNLSRIQESLDDKLKYSLKAREKFILTGNPFFLNNANGSIAIYYYRLGNIELFKQYMEESLSYGRNAGLLPEFGLILSEIGEHDKGLSLIQEALVEFVPGFNSMNYFDNPPKNTFYRNAKLTAEALRKKSEILFAKAFINSGEERQKLLNLSLESNELALYILKQEITQLNGFESSKLQYNTNINYVSLTFLKLYHNQWQSNKTLANANLFMKTMEQKKAASILDVLTYPDLPEATSKNRQKLLQQKQGYELKTELLNDSDSINFYNNKLLELSKNLENLEQEILKKNPKFKTFYEGQTIDLITLQKIIDKNTLFIHYGFGISNSIYVLAVSNQSYTLQHITIDSSFTDNVEDLISLLKNPLLIRESNKNEFIKISNKLYQKLLGPIEDELKNYKRILFANDEYLHSIPFEVLLPTAEQKPFNELDFLIKNYDISYQYSATIYSQLKNKPAIEDKSLLAFAPVFTGDKVGSTRAIDFLIDSLYQGVENERFAALPSTKTEVQTIAKTLEGQGQTTVLLESDATKANYNKAVQKQQYQFIHIATHGLVNFQNPRLSALACYSETDDVEQQLLFANEIQMQDIQADLVVLSSCESGIGQLVAGEGLIALNRSYVYSGANNVLFSLWKVSDKYSAELMINFYKAYMETNDYSAALRQAKLKMLKDPITANPRYWAAFVLIGE